MNDYCCQFTYNRWRDEAIITATGAVCPFNTIAAELGLTGQPCPEALTFKTFSEFGPKLFAVRRQENNGTSEILYYYEEQWIPYTTARNITFGARSHFLSTTAGVDDDDDDLPKEADGDGQTDNGKQDDFGRKPKDSQRALHSPKNVEMNQIICYFVLLWLWQLFLKLYLQWHGHLPSISPSF